MKIKRLFEFVDDNLELKFNQLKNKWLENYSFHSNPNLLYNNEYYNAIINIGEPIIPILIEDLNENNTNWLHALYSITGVNPIKPGNEGYFDKMKKDWNEWYIKFSIKNCTNSNEIY